MDIMWGVWKMTGTGGKDIKVVEVFVHGYGGITSDNLCQGDDAGTRGIERVTHAQVGGPAIRDNVSNEG